MNGITLTIRVWEPTGLCGCGECRFKNMRGKDCPQAENPDAILLWASRERDVLEPGKSYSSYDEPDPKDKSVKSQDCVTKFEKGGQHAVRA